MSAQPKQSFVTPEEYLDLDRAADFKSEYFSGEIVAMSGTSNPHESILFNLSGQLYIMLRGKSCKAKPGNLRVRVRTSNYLLPDLTVTCGTLEFADDHLDTLLNPTVIFEILSPSTESKDRGIKMRLYQQIPSLEHYVLIHQNRARVEIFTRHNDVDWLMHTESGLGAVMALSAIAVNVSLADLYEDVTLTADDGDE